MNPHLSEGQKIPALQQGIITVLFEKNFRGVRPALMNLNKSYRKIIDTTFTAPMTGEIGIEIIIVRGEETRIKSFERELMGKRGVRSARLTLIPA